MKFVKSQIVRKGVSAHFEELAAKVDEAAGRASHNADGEDGGSGLFFVRHDP